MVASAAMNAAIGPFPSPLTETGSWSTTRCAVIEVLPSSPVASSLERSCNGASAGRYVASNASHMAPGPISVPESSVMCWIVLENSIWRRRGRT